MCFTQKSSCVYCCLPRNVSRFPLCLKYSNKYILNLVYFLLLLQFRMFIDLWNFQHKRLLCIKSRNDLQSLFWDFLLWMIRIDDLDGNLENRNAGTLCKYSTNSRDYSNIPCIADRTVLIISLSSRTLRAKTKFMSVLMVKIASLTMTTRARVREQ